MNSSTKPIGTIDDMINDIKSVSKTNLENYMKKFLRPHQFMINESKNGFDVYFTYTPRGWFNPQSVVSSYLQVNLKKVKTL